MPLRLTVDGKPGKRSASISVRNGVLVVAVRERAVDGAANAAIERAVAGWLGVRASDVAIVHGATGRRKYVEVTGIDPDTVAQRIASSEPRRPA